MFTVLLTLLIPSFSNAFEPSQCPKKIVLNYEEFVGRDMTDLMTEKQYMGNYFGGVLQTSNNLKEYKFENVGMELLNTEGHCIYHAPNILAKISRSNSRLELTVFLNAIGASTTHKLEVVNPFGIKIARNYSSAPVVVHYSNAEFAVGWAHTLTIAVNGKTWRRIDDRIHLCKAPGHTLEIRGVGAPQMKLEFDRDRREKFVVTRTTACDANHYCYKSVDLTVNVPKVTHAFGLGDVFIEGKTPAAKFECREVD